MNYENLSFNYLSLNRFDEAKAIIEQALARQLDESVLHNFLAYLAFLRGDTTEMDHQFALSASDPASENFVLGTQGEVQAYGGRLSAAREFYRRAVESAEHNSLKEPAATWQATAAVREAYFGNRDRARQEAAAALAITSGMNVQPQAALAFALAGDAAHAQTIADELVKRYPKNIAISSYSVPTIRAVV